MLNRFIFKNVFPYTVYYLTPAGPLLFQYKYMDSKGKIITTSGVNLPSVSPAPGKFYIQTEPIVGPDAFIFNSKYYAGHADAGKTTL